MRPLPFRIAPFVVLVCALSAVPASALKPVGKPGWLTKFVTTEYYPAPEKWFVGARVDAPGLARKARVDWLYSARGLSMEGDGIGTDGKLYHIADVGPGGWVTETGKRARFGVGGAWSPFWRSSGFWKARGGKVTFPLLDGGWFAGEGKRYVPPAGITFAPGASRPLVFYRSVAVDPRLIPLGSLVYLPDYVGANGDGWFRADDTGGAIKGRHIDVYRRPPADSSDQGGYAKDRRIFVVPQKDVARYAATHGAAKTAAVSGRPPVPRSLLRRPALVQRTSASFWR